MFMGVFSCAVAARSETIEDVLKQLEPVSLNETALRKLASGFTPYAQNPVLAPVKGSTNDWDGGAIGSMTVVKAGRVYHMYYEAWHAKAWSRVGSDFGHLQIGHAVSLDGVHWAKDPANPVLRNDSTHEWESRGVWDPFVIYENGVFKMWYGGDNGRRCEGGFAISKDGSQFAKKGMIKHLEPHGFEDDHIVYDPHTGEYFMYYYDPVKAPWNGVMKNPLTAPWGLFVARSKNETDFDFKNAQRLAIEGQARPVKYSHVVRDKDKWVMFYGEAVMRGKPSSTGMAFSDDLLHWKKAAFPLINGHDAEVIEIAPNLWFMYYGPYEYFDQPGCDIRLAVYEGKLEDLAKH